MNFLGRAVAAIILGLAAGFVIFQIFDAVR